MWTVLILLGLAAMPLTIEWMRTGMTEAKRAKAPGQFALLSQGTTHYEWLGPERGPVAVCVHGLTTPSFVWYGMAKGLALMGFRVLVYDLYGRGYSDRLRAAQTGEFFEQQLLDLLAHERVTEPVTLLGYSMGGAVAAHMAATHPARVKQMVLLAPAGMFKLADRKIALARDLPLVGDWIFLATYPWPLRRGIAAEAQVPSSVERISDLQHAETTRRGFFPAVLSSLRGVLRDTTEAQHRAIAAAGIPVLAVWGGEDDVIPLSCKDTLSDWNPAAAQIVIDGAGHGLPYTHTDQVLDAIRTSRG